MKHQNQKVSHLLEINEIFGPTIQGEGLRAGVPSVFIRFGKCNLQCPGFNVEYITPSGIKKCSCDSYFASDSEFRQSWKKFKNHQELINEVNKIFPKYPCDLVITGGEPLLYWNDKEFQKLIKYYNKKNIPITIETNGTIEIAFMKKYQKNILFSISLKLSNSGENEFKRLKFKALFNIIKNTNSYLKFVIDRNFISKAEVEIDEILKQLPEVRVYLMPMGDTKDELEKNAIKVADLAIKKGFLYSDRLHIRLWDNSRGK